MAALLRSSHVSPLKPSPRLLQAAGVSGTAKGKAKIKAGQQLQRSKIPKSTPAKPADSSGGGGGRRGEAAERINRMIDSCLDAPTPVRYLSPKDRRREAEREKMGLISRDRQREIDAAKMKKGADRKEDEEEEERVVMGTPGLDLISLGVVDGEKVPKYELTVEDGRRLAKEYSRVLMRRHRARQASETTLLRLKKEAIAALPEKLRVAAMVPDLTPFPTNRYMATLTPPIEGYIEKVQEAARRTAGKEKLR